MKISVNHKVASCYTSAAWLPSSRVGGTRTTLQYGGVMRAVTMQPNGTATLDHPGRDGTVMQPMQRPRESRQFRQCRFKPRYWQNCRGIRRRVHRSHCLYQR
jgi:hypothetical protein